LGVFGSQPRLATPRLRSAPKISTTTVREENSRWQWKKLRAKAYSPINCRPVFFLFAAKLVEWPSVARPEPSTLKEQTSK